MMYKNFRSQRILVIGIVSLILCVFIAPTVFSKTLDEILSKAGMLSEQEEVQIVTGDLETVQTEELSRVAITEPSVADVVESDANHILVLGKSPGKTDIFLWDKNGKHTIRVWVYKENLELAEARLSYLLQAGDIPDIEVVRSDLEGKIIVSGEVSKEKKKDFDKVIEPFSASIVNLVKDKIERALIQIDVQVAEVSTSFTKTLGIEWTSALTYTEEAVSTDTFRIGDLNRTTSVSSIFSALITEGKAKVISKPKLVTKSGEEASFNVGGEIPIKTTTTSSGGNVEENVEFKPYGVSLSIKATAKEDDKIDVDLSVDIKDIDAATATLVSENVAFTNRSAKTKLFLDDGQTVVLAGFIKQSKGENVSRVPFLSDVPILGAVFRKRTVDPSSETELFITLTPKIVATNKAEKTTAVPLMTEIKDEEPLVADPVAPVQAVAPLPSPEAAVSVRKEMANYAKALQERIAGALTFPEEAKAQQQQGNIYLDLTIAHDGRLLESSVKGSSGYPLLDKTALDTVQGLSPFEPLPADVVDDQLTVSIPIVFRLSAE